MTEKYLLKLYITGMTPKVQGSIDNLKKICDEHLDGNCDLEIINILEQPQQADDARILATPTLVKQLPDPVRRIIGDLSDTDKVVVGLDLSVQ